MTLMGTVPVFYKTKYFCHSGLTFAKILETKEEVLPWPE